MPTGLQNLAGLMKNTRSRIIIIVTFVVFIIAIAIGWNLFHTTTPGAQATAQVAGIPGIQSIPGSEKASVQYIKTQAEANRQQAEQAIKTGTSAVPTILRSAYFEQSTFTPKGTGTEEPGYGGACSNLQNQYPYCFAQQDETGLSSDDLEKLLAACRPGVPIEVCKKALDQLVAEGKLSPEEAQALLNSFGKGGELTPAEAGDALLSKMGLPKDIAEQIREACGKNGSAAKCQALLKKLEEEGKISPEQARKLLTAYGRDQLTPDEEGNALLKQMDVPEDIADQIREACGKEGSAAECQALLKKLEAEGKLSPEQAEKLLKAYGRDQLTPDEKGNALLSKMGLPEDIAAQIRKACGKNGSAAKCQALLKKLEDEGLLTPNQAKKLLAAYGREGEKPTSTLGRMLSDGEVSPLLAKRIEEACNNGSTKQCQDLLRKLVSEGKISPRQARRIMAESGRAPTQNLKGAGTVGQLAKAGLLTSDEANALDAACRKPGGNEKKCTDLLNKLISEGKLTPDQAKKLLAAYGRQDAANQIQDGLAQTQPLTTTTEPTTTDGIPTTAEIPSATGVTSQDQRLQQILKAQADEAKNQQLQAELQEIEGQMNTQATSLFTSWNPPPTQTVVSTTIVDDKKDQDTDEGEASGAAKARQRRGSTSSNQGIPDVKAGNIQYGVLTGSVNSDYTTAPVMAKIVQGKFRGAKLLGKLQREKKRVIISFNLMTLPDYPRSITISAVAIDLETAKAAMASHVNSHYLLRYGTLFASSFMTGYSQAVSNSGSTLNISVNGITKTTRRLSPREEIAVALGDVGTQWGAQLTPLFNTPPTVVVNAGTGIGVLFLKDLTIKKN